MSDEQYGRRDLSTVMPNNLNEEAIVFRGLTSSEIVIVSLVTFTFWFVVMLVVGSMIGSILLTLGFTLILVAISVFGIATVMQKIKRGRPPGHYMHLITLFLGKNKIKRCSHVIYDGTYSMGRTKQVILADRHLGADVTNIGFDQMDESE